MTQGFPRPLSEYVFNLPTFTQLLLCLSVWEGSDSTA